VSGAWLTDDVLRGHASGVVEKPESYNYRTYLPERRGLYCEAIFGPVHWKASEVALASDDRSDRWGRIELSAPTARTGGHRSSVVMVVPPTYRRWVSLSPTESRERARQRRAELVALDASGAWPHCDPLEKLLAEEGLESDADIEAREGGLVEPPLNVAYRTLVNLSNRLRRYGELNVPEPVQAEDRAALVIAWSRLDGELSAAGLPADVLARASGRG
jgi:hypothetical protein